MNDTPDPDQNGNIPADLLWAKIGRLTVERDILAARIRELEAEKETPSPS